MAEMPHTIAATPDELNPAAGCEWPTEPESLLDRMKRSIYKALCWNSPDSQTYFSRQRNNEGQSRTTPACDFLSNKEALLGVVKKCGDYLLRETCTFGQPANTRVGREERLMDTRNGRKSTPCSRNEPNGNPPCLRNEPNAKLCSRNEPNARSCSRNEPNARSCSRNVQNINPYSRNEPNARSCSRNAQNINPYSRNEPNTNSYSRNEPNARPCSRNYPRVKQCSRRKRRFAYSYENARGVPTRNCGNETNENVANGERKYVDMNRLPKISDSRLNHLERNVEAEIRGRLCGKNLEERRNDRTRGFGEGERERRMRSVCHASKHPKYNVEGHYDGKKCADMQVRRKLPERDPKDTGQTKRNCGPEFERKNCDKKKEEVGILNKTCLGEAEKDRKARSCLFEQPKERNKEAKKEGKIVYKSEASKKCKQIYELSEDQCRHFKERGYVKVNVRVKPNVSVSDFDIVIRKDKIKPATAKA